MREYKVVRCKMKLTRNDEILEDFLNQHAKAGWVLKKIDNSFLRVIFERDKNR